MPSLALFDTYTREEVHSIFAPNTRFTPQSGTWGLHGIIPIPDRPGDFIFFVTFGQQQGEHVFDEGITEDGVLSWQSQPKQNLQNKQIHEFINHDPLTNTIYLFLRTGSRRPYTYLGRLKYLSHDAERENPVYFQWQLIDWPTDHTLLASVTQPMDLKLQPTTTRSSFNNTVDRNTVNQATSNTPDHIVQEGPQLHSSGRRHGTPTRTFRTQKVADYAEIDAKNHALGRAGEIFVLEHERKTLTQLGRPDLAAKVQHTAEVEGDGAGYDILSFEPDEAVKYIEVKTTRGSDTTAFFISANELEFARRHTSSYFLYRVYNYDIDTNSGQIYILTGEFEDSGSYELTPTNYRVRPK